MTDVTQGADAPDDASLFSDATTTTLEKFENPEPPPPPKPEEKKPDAPQEPKPEQPDAPVPAGRLREESEARRRVERERDDLLRQLATARQPPQQQPQQKPPDVFENPSGFVQSEVKPFFEQMRQEMQMQREAFSHQMAVSSHGSDKVMAARQSLEQGMSRGDQDAWGIYNRAMQSANPYDVITRWHLNNETMREVGGDINGYRSRVLEEAMKDPDFQRKVIEASKGSAQHVARPITSSVPKIPSLGNVGAGGDTELQEPSDEQLFRAAVTARRK